MTRYIHPLSTMVFAYTHHPDRTVRHRMDGLMDTGQYESSRDELRRKAEACGARFDCADADAVWDRRRQAKARYDAADMEWQLGCVGLGPDVPHPGSLKDWMDDE